MRSLLVILLLFPIATLSQGNGTGGGNGKGGGKGKKNMQQEGFEQNKPTSLQFGLIDIPDFDEGKRKELDSIYLSISSSIKDTNAIKQLVKFSKMTTYSDPLKFKSLSLAKNISDSLLLLPADSMYLKKVLILRANVMHILAGVYQLRGDYYAAIDMWEMCLNDRKLAGSERGVFGPLNNIANAYSDLGKFDKSIKIHTNILNKRELENKSRGIGQSHNNIGVVYAHMGDYDKALEHQIKAFSIQTSIHDSVGLPYTYFNIAQIYLKQEQFTLSKRYADSALFIFKRKWDEEGMAAVYQTFGDLSSEENRKDEAVEWYQKSLSLKIALNDQLGLVGSLSAYGGMYLDQEDFLNAQLVLTEGLTIAKSIGAQPKVRDLTRKMYLCYKGQGDYKKAMAYLQNYIALRDSLNSELNQKALIQQEFEYEYEKKAAADSIQALEVARVQEALLTAEKAETEKQKTQIKQQEQQKYFLFGGLSLALLFGGFIFNRFRVTRKQKGIIEEQKVLVEQQKTEVESQKLELEHTHQQLEEHHKEIADSIMYAKRIQEAIMPSMRAMDAALKDGFVLYLPKDVVAGDFFWMEQMDDVTYYAAADCTGHGVPGAMVSVVCSNALNKGLLEEGIRDTGKLLDRTREIVIDRLAKSGEEVKDGMDISLCALNNKTKQIKWSGANNPLWILRKGAQELEEIKANKQPIGKYTDPKPFTEHTLQLNEGDTVYVFTDGYQDQFGGPKGKKFKAQQLKDILVTNQNLSMDEQMELLQNKFMEWKGAVEQIDDVCIIGVRV